MEARVHTAATHMPIHTGTQTPCHSLLPALSRVEELAQHISPDICKHELMQSGYLQITAAS